MASPAPRMSIAKPTGFGMARSENASNANGVLSISASATHRRIQGHTQGHAGRMASPRLKVVVRRLPPGLTRLEFDTALGEEWKVGGQMVDWAVYKDGKVSKEYVDYGLTYQL